MVRMGRPPTVQHAYGRALIAKLKHHSVKHSLTAAVTF